MLALCSLGFLQATTGPDFEAAFLAARPAVRAPAVAAAVVRDGRVVWTKADGFLDPARTKRATPTSKFRIASLTKAFTATLVLQLVAEGKLALDDPIGSRLPSLPAAWHAATVRQILGHTGGIPSYTDLPEFAQRLEAARTPAQIVAWTADKPLDFPPGSAFRYSNSGYVVLGMLVERLDGRPFGKALAARILGPLGMGDTRFDAGGPKPTSEGFDAEGKPSRPFNMSLPYAAGSVVSTAADMAKWLVAQGSERLLPAHLWNEAWRPGLAQGKPTGYGLGWTLGTMNDVPTVEHGGGILGFTTFLRRVPVKGLAAVVLTNAEGAEPTLLASRLLEAADPTLKTPDAEIPDPDPKVTRDIERLFLGLAKGEPDRSLMADGLSKAITPEAVDRGRDLLARLGTYGGMRLVKADGARRTYLLRFEKGALRLQTAHDAAGRFTLFAIAPA